MHIKHKCLQFLLITVCLFQVNNLAAQKVVPYEEGDYLLSNFKFGDGHTLDSLRLHYYYVGTPHKNAKGQVDNFVLITHGTGGSAMNLLTENFAGQLFRAGQPLDASKYFVVLPDGIGHGKSSKPSDGLKMKFPAYTYDDMVDALYLMATKHLKVNHARLITGTSMGGMQAWVWGERYPDFMDALMPLASAPVEIAGRNRMMRKMIIDAIKEDPNWENGNYKVEPAYGLKNALNILALMGSAPLQWQKDAPTKEAAEIYLDKYLVNAAKGKDVNDMIYQFEASRKYNPAPDLYKIKAPLMAINSADDQVNPPELKILDTAILKIPHSKFILLPITNATRGHGTHSLPAIWSNYLINFLRETEK
jgi:homoserine O-acetyltransferase